MENDGWVTLQPNPVDLCRWWKKPTGEKSSLCRTPSKCTSRSTGARCQGATWKLLRHGSMDLVGRCFFSFWFGFLGRKTKVRKKKVEELCWRFYLFLLQKVGTVSDLDDDSCFLYILLGEKTGEKNQPKNPHKFMNFNFPHLAAAQ